MGLFLLYSIYEFPSLLRWVGDVMSVWSTGLNISLDLCDSNANSLFGGNLLELEMVITICIHLFASCLSLHEILQFPLIIGF